MTNTESKTTTQPVTTSGWYEHTDRTFGYYSWRTRGGVRCTELDVDVENYAATMPTEAIERLKDQAETVSDFEMAMLCDLALEGHDFAIVACIRAMRDVQS